MSNFSTIIMAAGKGTRMKSDLAKVLHPLLDRPMIHYVIELAKALQSERIISVIGHQKEEVRSALAEENIEFVIQEPQLGTGHAVMQAEELLGSYSGDVLILSGDAPLLTIGTTRLLLSLHQSEGATATVLTAVLPDPSGYGRIIRQPDGSVMKIVEHKDATDEERIVCEINSGIYVFSSKRLFDVLKKIRNDNAQKEYYLPDVIPMLLADGQKVCALVADDYHEISGINTLEQLLEAEIILTQRHRIS